MGSPSKHAPHEESDESEEEVLQEISPDDINVAIFCALVEESTAVRYTLDREFACKAYGKQSYVYTVGSIGAHNVVIAEPAEMGPVNAAHCAAHVSQQFPNVRLALMVGIGAGIPSNKLDIRLGDIAISAPRDDHPGVIQYDLGKYEAGAFKRKGALNKPPRILSSAIRALEGDELRNKSPIRRILKRIITQNNKFRWPDSEDILFHNTFPHVQEGSDCSACWASDDKRVVSRLPRQLPSEPVTHRGLILSGVGVIKNPADREQFHRGYESAICFEMEAAGIMDELPCLVIRGISDYADTHKHDEWHYYAAAAAAAYCKAILSKVPVEEVTETPRIREVVKKVDEIQRTVQDTRATAKEIHAIAHFDKIREWLLPPDPSTNFNKAREQHYEKTGQWFLDSELYIKWKTERNSFLWLQGIPGCGKTILSSSVVTDLQDEPSRSLIYFYFDFSDVAKQTLEQAARSLIYQLYHKQADLQEEVDDLYSSCDNGGRQPLRSSLLELFKSMIRRAGEVWIVLDALDECHTRNESVVSGLMSYIKSFRDSTTNLHLLVTSRPEHDIQSAIQSWAQDSEILPLESIRVKDDINSYIEFRLGQLSRWRERPRIQKEIKTVLSNKANGMFRWVSCQFDVLSGCLDPESVQRELASLPRTLDETYERILKTIEPSRLDSAIRLLQFLVYSNRPLRLEEAVDAVAVNISKEPMFDPEYRMPCQEEIVGYCSSLTVLIKRKDQRYRTEIVEIQLAHFSVQEYLTSERLEESIALRLSHSSASIALTTVCLSYLLSLDYSYRPEEAEKNYPLAHYSAQYWPMYAAVTEQSTNSTLPVIRKYFSSITTRNFCCLIYNPDEFQGAVRHQQIEAFDSLYYASLTGLVYSAKELVNDGANINAQGGRYGSALQAASNRGHQEIVQLLVDNGANVNAQGGRYGSALQAASKRGHQEIVRILVNYGADVDSQHWPYGTVLQSASEGGHPGIVQFLLANEADVNAQGGQYGNALYAASFGGRQGIVQLLLNNQADVNAEGGYFGNALQAASIRGHWEIVQLLLDYQADVNAKGGYFGNALQAASIRGHWEIVQLLLDYQADVNTEGGWYSNASEAALSGRYQKIVQLLNAAKEARDDINLQGSIPPFFAVDGDQKKSSVGIQRQPNKRKHTEPGQEAIMKKPCISK